MELKHITCHEYCQLLRLSNIQQIMNERTRLLNIFYSSFVDKEHGHLHRTEHEGADRGPYSQPPDICQETVSLRNFVSFEMINGECI